MLLWSRAEVQSTCTVLVLVLRPGCRPGSDCMQPSCIPVKRGLRIFLFSSASRSFCIQSSSVIESMRPQYISDRPIFLARVARKMRGALFPLPAISITYVPVSPSLLSLSSPLYLCPSFCLFPCSCSLTSLLVPCPSIFLPLAPFIPPPAPLCLVPFKVGLWVSVSVCRWHWWISDSASVVSDDYNSWLLHLCGGNYKHIMRYWFVPASFYVRAPG